MLEPASVNMPRRQLSVGAAQLKRFQRVVRHRERIAARRSPTTMASPSRAKRSRPSGKAGSPSARQVPRLVHSGRPWRRDSASAQPTWSPCSWVTNTASRSADRQPGAREPGVELALREAAVHEHAARGRAARATRSPARCRHCRCPGCKSASRGRRVNGSQGSERRALAVRHLTSGRRAAA